jgi:hypothetical protein
MTTSRELDRLLDVPLLCKTGSPAGETIEVIAGGSLIGGSR